MRVALVQELGGIDSVELQERAHPTPAAGQAVVKVGGAGVGPWDVATISGAFGRPALPYVPGFEVAGVVATRVIALAEPKAAWAMTLSMPPLPPAALVTAEPVRCLWALGPRVEETQTCE